MYLTSSLALFCISIDIAISLQRYFILLNRTFCVQIRHKLLIFSLLVIALLLYLPVFFIMEITETKKENGTVTEYLATKTKLGLTSFGQVFAIFNGGLRWFLVAIFLTSLNILNSYEFKKRFRKNKNMMLTSTTNQCRSNLI